MKLSLLWSKAKLGWQYEQWGAAINTEEASLPAIQPKVALNGLGQDQ